MIDTYGGEALSLRPADLDAAWRRARAKQQGPGPHLHDDPATEALAVALWNDENPGRPFGWTGGASFAEKRQFLRRAYVARLHLGAVAPVLR